MMKDNFIVVSLYVDERKLLPATEQVMYRTKSGSDKQIRTVGDKWATFQSENFDAVSQPQYAILSPDEKVLTKTKGYTPAATEFAAWLKCGIGAMGQAGDLIAKYKTLHNGGFTRNSYFRSIVGVYNAIFF
jgi:hypothetical protein